MIEKELSNILTALTFNQLQWMPTSSSWCINLEVLDRNAYINQCGGRSAGVPAGRHPSSFSVASGAGLYRWRLKTSIKSARFRRSSTVYSPSFCNLSSYCNDWKLVIIRLNLCCTFPRNFLSFWCGDRADVQYTRCGRTKVLYRFCIRWQQKSTGIDVEQNYVTVTLCIKLFFESSTPVCQTAGKK